MFERILENLKTEWGKFCERRPKIARTVPIEEILPTMVMNAVDSFQKGKKYYRVLIYYPISQKNSICVEIFKDGDVKIKLLHKRNISADKVYVSKFNYCSHCGRKFPSFFEAETCRECEEILEAETGRPRIY